MDAMEELIHKMYSDPDSAFDFLSNEGHQFRQSELLDISRELIYAAYEVFGKGADAEIMKRCAENLAERNEIDLDDEQSIIIPEQNGGRK